MILCYVYLWFYKRSFLLHLFLFFIFDFLIGYLAPVPEFSLSSPEHLDCRGGRLCLCWEREALAGTAPCLGGSGTPQDSLWITSGHSPSASRFVTQEKLLYFTGFHRHGSMHKTGNLSRAKVKRGFPKFFFSLMESPPLSYSKPAWMWSCSRWACCGRGWAHEVQRSLPTPGTPDPTLQPLGNCDLQPLTWINGWKSSSSKWLLLLLSVLRSPISPSTKTLV